MKKNKKIIILGYKINLILLTIGIILFFLIKLILNYYNLEYRKWIYNTFSILGSILLSVIIILTLILLVKKIAKEKKLILIVMIVVTVIFCFYSCKYIMIYYIFDFSEQEYISNNKKEVILLWNFKGIKVEYYDYVNSFVRKKKLNYEYFYNDTNWNLEKIINREE